MAQLVNAGLLWLERTLGWSNSRESWQERLAFGIFLAAAACVLAVRSHLSLAQELILWSGLLLALAVLLRRNWGRLFGPMLFYDLLMIGRRKRYFFMRALYALVLAVLVCWMYLIFYLENNQGRMQIHNMASFANTFFQTFMGVQFVIIVLLTPAYTAGAVADEKDRKTLEFLLATDLRNREIVLSKFMSRVANLGFLILAGLPILSFMQFLGGVDPNLVFAGYAVTALTMISLAALSILNSVVSKKARDAIAMTYLGGLAYMIVSGVSWLLLISSLGLSAWPSTASWTSPITLEDLVVIFSAGNPIAALVQVIQAIESGKHVEAIVPVVTRNYAIFHGLLVLICCTWAVLRLRKIALKETQGRTTKKPWRGRLSYRPGVGNFPMLWKELLAERGLRFNVLGRIMVLVLVIAGFVPVAIILYDAINNPGRWGVGGGRNVQLFGPQSDVARAFNVWVRLLGTVVACLLLLGVAARAASSISGERDRQTWDGLLTSPLGALSILLAKWLGNIASVRWGWLWLGMIYFLGLISSGLDVFALPLLLLAWFAYAGALSSIGMWYSIVSRTTLRATIWTLLTTVGAGVGHWIIWMCFVPIFWNSPREPKFFEWLAKFQVGLTPPAVFSYSLSFCEQDYTDRHSLQGNEFFESVGIALLGTGCWILATFILMLMTYYQLAATTGRGKSFRKQLTPAGQMT
jgi:ABC-type transport system involved in multi-copper enzyme maturation permease subunit